MLDKRYSFVLPASLVEQEFSSIWGQVEAEQTQSGRSFADEGHRRRRRRGRIIAGSPSAVSVSACCWPRSARNPSVQVTDDEISAIRWSERVRQFPGQEQAVWDYYRKNAQAMATVRAPLYEEKVVDHILSQAKVTDKTVSKEELFKADEPELTSLSAPADEPVSPAIA